VSARGTTPGRSRPSHAGAPLARTEDEILGAIPEGRRGTYLDIALLDRLLHKSHVFNIRDRSYRLRDLEKLPK